MKLLNTSVGVLLDDTGSRPEDLDFSLRDFKYERLTPLTEPGGKFGKLRDSHWYIDWLARDLSDLFQPY